MTMKTILTSELSKRATTNTEKAPFASIISISSPEGRNEIMVRVALQSVYGREEKAYLLPLEMLDEVSISLKSVPYEIDEEMLDTLVRCDAVARALHRAYGIIAYGACSYRKLARKLREKGVESEIADMAIEIVKSKDYINEDYLAQRVCELCVKKYWGRSRIIRKLREDGYCEEAIDSAIEYLDTVDFSEQCAELIEKRYMLIPSDKYEMQKTFASIARYGYSGSEIKEAVKIYNSRN